MTYESVPHFVIKRDLQKSEQTGRYFDDIVTREVLSDVCRKITGEWEFSFEYVGREYEDAFVPAGYNKGRLAILYHGLTVYYITFSEKTIDGRNSSVQSVPTAYNLFYTNAYPYKKICYYFLNEQGNVGTDYHWLIYRLMATVGFRFLNAETVLGQNPPVFTSIEDIMHTRLVNASRNRSNRSSYITKSGERQFDIYGKTYGANKYETSLMCYALSQLAKKNQRITLYEILEGDLAELPQASLRVLRMMGNVRVIPTDQAFEEREFERRDSLRSPRYIYHLLERLGEKRCMLCNCEIPELVQGAHVWPVAEIKKTLLPPEEQMRHAQSGENGLWLCENHHKLFDANFLLIRPDGSIAYRAGLDAKTAAFMNEITKSRRLPAECLTPGFLHYLSRRNGASN